MVSPVKSPSMVEVPTPETAAEFAASTLTFDGSSSDPSFPAAGDADDVDGTFQGSTTEALRVEILRLREENRRLHAMRRSSCDNRRSGDGGASTSTHFR